MIQEAVTIPAGSASLAGTLFLPENSPPQGVVLLSGATGIPHGYYQHFAAWLADEHTLACLTYDYSDFGASLEGPMKHSTATMALWAVRDHQAARTWLLTRVPDVPLTTIGHSLGALGHGFHAPEERLEQVITVASGPAYQKEHPLPYRLFVYLFWHVLGPVFTAINGYLPGEKLGLGANIPKGVFWQWRRWCTRHDFFARDNDTLLANPRSLTGNLKIVAIADDEMIPPHVVQRLASWHPQAETTQMTLDPKTYGLDKIGHLAVFRRKNAVLWPAILGG